MVNFFKQLTRLLALDSAVSGARSEAGAGARVGRRGHGKNGATVSVYIVLLLFVYFHCVTWMILFIAVLD